jgi:hypothetical protein
MTWSYVLLITVLLIQQVTSAMIFQQVNSSCGWAPRMDLQVQLLRNPLKYHFEDHISEIPVGSFILYAGLCQIFQAIQCNDVWFSTDRGQSWNSLPQSSQRYTTYYSVTFSDPLRDRFYVMSDSGHPGFNDVSPLWRTTNLSTWDLVLPIKNSSGPTIDRSSFGSVVDSQGDIYYMTSENYTLSHTHSQKIFHDVWKSTNEGRTWSMVTAPSQFSARYASDIHIHYRNPHLQNRDIIYLHSGLTYSGSEPLRDIWVSSDGAVSWSLLIRQVPWRYTWRKSFHITPSGVMIAATDYQSSTPGTLWLSLDGGYTWGICVKDAVYYPRHAASVVTDKQGYPYIIAGGTNDGKYNNDVWRGTISLKNWTGIAAACELKVPVEGVGLSRWPGAPETQSSSSGGQTRYYSSSTAIGSSSANLIPSSTARDSSSSTESVQTEIIVASIVVIVLVLISTYFGCRYYYYKQQLVNQELNQALIE